MIIMFEVDDNIEKTKTDNYNKKKKRKNCYEAT